MFDKMIRHLFTLYTWYILMQKGGVDVLFHQEFKTFTKQLTVCIVLASILYIANLSVLNPLLSKIMTLINYKHQIGINLSDYDVGNLIGCKFGKNEIIFR